MSVRVDPETMFCHAHAVHACIVCMTEDYYDWLPTRWLSKDRRAELRELEHVEPKHGKHRFELGGEG